MLAASYQTCDDLGHTALGALMRVSCQVLHMRLKNGEERIAVVPEKTLWWGRKNQAICILLCNHT